MVQWHGLSRRKVTGGYLRLRRGKRRHELGRDAVPCVLGDKPVRKHLRTRGANKKVRALSLESANVTNPADGTTKNVSIKNVVENTANPHFVRRNIITKGAVIETDLGKARVTSRPGQTGAINAVLLE